MVAAAWIHLQQSKSGALCDEKLDELLRLVETNLARIAEGDIAPAKLKKTKKLPLRKNRLGKAVTPTNSKEQTSSHDAGSPPLQRNDEVATSGETYNAGTALNISKQKSDFGNLPAEVSPTTAVDEVEEQHGQIIAASISENSPREAHEVNSERNKDVLESAVKEVENGGAPTRYSKRQRAAAATGAELNSLISEKPVERRQAPGRRKSDLKQVDDATSTNSRSTRSRRCRKVSQGSSRAAVEHSMSPAVAKVEVRENFVADGDQVVGTSNETCSSELAVAVEPSVTAVHGITIPSTQVLELNEEQITPSTIGPEDYLESSTALTVQKEQNAHTLEQEGLQNDTAHQDINLPSSKPFVPPLQRRLELPTYKIPSRLPDSPSSENEGVSVRVVGPISKPDFNKIQKDQNYATDNLSEIEEFRQKRPLGELTPGADGTGRSESSIGAPEEMATGEDMNPVSAVSATTSNVSSASYAGIELELREKRLKDYFNSNAEKIKKALSSLRSAPQQSALTSTQRAASLDIGSDLRHPYPLITSASSTVLSNPRSSDPTSLSSSHSIPSSSFPARGKLTNATWISTKFPKSVALENETASESSDSFCQHLETSTHAEKSHPRQSLTGNDVEQHLSETNNEDPATDKGNGSSIFEEDNDSGPGKIADGSINPGNGDDDNHYRRRSVAQVVKAFEERNRIFHKEDNDFCNQAAVKLDIKVTPNISTTDGQRSEEKSAKPATINHSSSCGAGAITAPVVEHLKPSNARLVDETFGLVEPLPLAAETERADDLIENERKDRRSLGVPVSQTVQIFERKRSASSFHAHPDSTTNGLKTKSGVYSTSSIPSKSIENLQQKHLTQRATSMDERDADTEFPVSGNDGFDNPQMVEQNPDVSTSSAVPSPLRTSSSLGLTSVRSITELSFSKIGQLPPNLVMSTTSFVAELAEKEKAKQLEKEKQRERDRKPEVKSLLAAASAAKKEQQDKERRAAAKNLGMERHALAQQKKEAEEAKRLEALRKKDEEVRKRAKTALEMKKKDDDDSRKRRQDRDRQVQERQRQLAKEREEIQQRVLNKAKKVPDKDERETEIRKADSKKRIRPVGNEEEQRNLSVASSHKSMSTLVARRKSVFEPESEIENKRQKTTTEISRTSSRRDGQSPNKNPLSTPLAKSNGGFVQMQYTSKGMVARPKTPLTIFSGKNAVCATPELPEIHTDDDSDDSNDENYSSRKKRPQPEYPDWTQSPAIRQAMLRQSASNPDTIFTGTMQTLNMEEIFSCRDKHFRARSSSGHWNGADRLTAQEELKYKQAMGYKD